MAKLMNLDEEIPTEFYIFVNEANPVTEHNFRTVGTFFSAAFASLDSPGFLQKYVEGSVRYLPFAPCEREPMALSPYCLSAINDYRLEYDLEIYRESNCKLFPSRLSAVYAFGSRDDCEKVKSSFGWTSPVHRFRLVDHPLNRVAKVNMQHVSLARHAYKVSQFDGIDQLCRQYWSGTGNIALSLPAPGFTRRTHQSGVIWEYLIEGVLRRMD